MNAGEMKEEILRLLNTALETGDVETLIEETGRLSKVYQEAYQQATAELLAPVVEGMFEFVRESPDEFRPQIARIGWWVLEVINRAKLRNWERCSRFSNQAKSTLAYDLEAYRPVLSKSFIKIERDFSNMRQVLDLLLNLLSSYQRRIAYLRGLLQIEEGKEPEMDGLSNLPAWATEQALENAYGRGLVLGPEYRHIRNALAHGKVRVVQGKRSVSLRDRDWKAAYTFPEFVATFHHAWGWMSGWNVAYNYQQLMTAKRVVVDPRSFEQPVKWD